MFFKSNNLDVNILSVLELHWHRVNAHAGDRPFHCLAYRLIGNARIFPQGKKTLHTMQDDITFVPAKCDFSKQAGEGKIIAVHFSSPCELPDEPLRFASQKTSQFRNKFERLYQVWTQKKPGYEYEAKILLYRIILEIEQEYSSSSSTPQYLDDILEYINGNFSNSNLSVAELSQMAGTSDTYFRKLFVAKCGMTPQKYINHLRLTHASELLQSGYYNISEIASRCGFNNINYFSTFIKKETGLSPVSYRKFLLSALPTASTLNFINSDTASEATPHK